MCDVVYMGTQISSSSLCHCTSVTINTVTINSMCGLSRKLGIARG